ncbi:hypothetical protein GGX14DRAFT_359122 [Mycena pura]|uniref:BTB domain-containing protein n=1 Tax=Mycena pura TaxID=153505 RepID=A0AAD6VPP3_9AGAR|nr:hypothetical protein GGX14DRAFT_359122 [Mycena pura]
MSDPGTIKPVDGLWFTNDIVILRAEDSISGFRVSQSILAARSTVFQSMFEFPQPASDSVETLDGIPVVRLHDSAAEVEPFLRAIFDSSYFMPPPAKIDVHAVLGILRLSHKYAVGYLFKRALLHLEIVFPIDVEQARNIDVYSGQLHSDLKAVPILQEVGAAWLLPVAFYKLAIYDEQTLLDAGDSWTNFPADMKQTCLLARTQQLHMNNRINGFLALFSCASNNECAEKRALLLRDLVTYRDSEAYQLHPLSEWNDEDWLDLASDLCDVCFALARAQHEVDLGHVWDQLPKNCGLEDWKTLKELRRVAME